MRRSTNRDYTTSAELAETVPPKRTASPNIGGSAGRCEIPTVPATSANGCGNLESRRPIVPGRLARQFAEVLEPRRNRINPRFIKRKMSNWLK
jgi:hypothetical protein